MVILIVAAVGAGLMLTSSSSDEDDLIASSGGQLEVYGNANEDFYINDKDVKLIEDIVKDNIDWKTEYPFADANQDGIVDDKDVKQVKDIMNATSDKKVKIWHNNEVKDKKYVVDTMYPITSTLSTTMITTAITLKTIGIVDEIKGTTFRDSNPDNFDKYVFEDYFPVINAEHQVGTNDVNLDTASNFVTKYGCSAYLCSGSSSTPSNMKELEGAGIDVVQIADAVSNPDSYKSAIVLLAFLFTCDDKPYFDNALKFIVWLDEYYEDLNAKLAKVTDKKSSAASSMTSYVSVKGSPNSDIVEQAGLDCPVIGETSSQSTKKYIGGTDTWLNAYNLDSLIILKGSSSGWSWFDGTYDDLPSSFATHMKNYESLDCSKKGNTVIVSVMMPSPLKSGAIAQYSYPTVFEAGWIEGYLSDFFQTFWGFDASDCDKFKYVLTPAEVL